MTATATHGSPAGPTVAIFGGSFNPPHVVHQLVGLYVLETEPVDELWFVPTFRHPLGKELTSYDHRIAMCELATAALGPRVRVSRAEQELANRPGFIASRTLDLLDLLAERHPDHSWRLVVGSDILDESSRWYRWDEVVARAPLIVVRRAGHALGTEPHATSVVMPGVSATLARDLLATRDPGIAGLLPRQVLVYIASHRLYL